MTAPGAAIRPKLVRVPTDRLLEILAQYAITLSEATRVAAIGIRGWAESQAGGGANKTGVYDDAICVITRAGSWTYQGNTDPTRTIEGRAIAEAGQVVEMSPVIHHRTRPPAERRFAFGQASGVTIRRYADGDQLGVSVPNQYIGWNLHDGSITTTGSEACQTVAPEWWPGTVRELLVGLGLPLSELPTVETRIKQGLALPDHWEKARFPYVLVDG